MLEHWLYDATGLLLTPVIATLVALGAFALVMFGGFLREGLERRASRPAPARSATPMAPLAHLLAQHEAPGMLGRFAREARSAADDPRRLAEVATRCELEATRRVSRLNLVARAGPTLGLMATLIPMGPALMALADNDVSGLARSLVVAFTATVCGLLVGLLCATMGTVRRHWYAADLTLVDELLERAEALPR
ncbi:MAG: MotA/TolQ/ExbB proton channel family protein [Planctomycetota bacterium]